LLGGSESVFRMGEGPQWRVRYARRGALERRSEPWANQSGQIGRIPRGRGLLSTVRFFQ